MMRGRGRVDRSQFGLITSLRTIIRNEATLEKKIDIILFIIRFIYTLIIHYRKLPQICVIKLLKLQFCEVWRLV